MTKWLIFSWGKKKKNNHAHMCTSLKDLPSSDLFLRQFSPSSDFLSLPSWLLPQTHLQWGTGADLRIFCHWGEDTRVLNSSCGRKKRFSSPVVGNHALEIQRNDLQVRRPAMAVPTSLKNCLVGLCHRTRATLPSQLSGQ